MSATSSSASSRKRSASAGSNCGRHLARPPKALLARADHAQELEDAWFIRAVLGLNVIAEPLGLLVCVGVAVDIGEQPGVVGRDAVGLANADSLADAQGDHRLAQAVLHRLATTEIGGEGKGRHELREPDTAPVATTGHRGSLDLIIPPRVAEERGIRQIGYRTEHAGGAMACEGELTP
jgi:hypothetical protein